MASEPYERPAPPNRARAINERQVLAGSPPQFGAIGHLTISPESGRVEWSEAPQSGRTVVYAPVELSWDEPEVVVSNAEGWAVGLTEEQVRTIVAVGGTHQQRLFLADGYRQANAAQSEPGGSVRRPRYVNPSDAANPDAGGHIIETLREREASPEEKARRRYLPVPADAANDSHVPVAFTDVTDNLSRVIPQMRRQRARGPRGSKGPVRDFKGRRLDID